MSAPLISFDIPIFRSKNLRQNYVNQLAAIYQGHFPSKLPLTLFHYTSIQSFKGIVASNQIWFGHVSSMQDATEVMRAVELSKVIINATLQSSGVNQRAKMLLERMLSGLLNSNANSRWYVASFTEAFEDAAQWQRFGDNYKGICIEFDTLELIKYFSASIEDRPFFGKVVYDTQELLNFGSKLLAAALSNFDDDYSHIPDDDTAAQQFIPLWGDLVDVFSIIPKVPSYSSEKEWRFAIDASKLRESDKNFIEHNGKKKLKQGKGLASDYVATKLPIASVRLGPHCSENEQLQIEYELRNAGFVDVKIAKSILQLNQ